MKIIVYYKEIYSYANDLWIIQRPKAMKAYVKPLLQLE